MTKNEKGLSISRGNVFRSRLSRVFFELSHNCNGSSSFIDLKSRRRRQPAGGIGIDTYVTYIRAKARAGGRLGSYPRDTRYFSSTNRRDSCIYTHTCVQIYCTVYPCIHPRLLSRENETSRNAKQVESLDIVYRLNLFSFSNTRIRKIILVI